jgi:hypothetical protein
MHEINGHYTGGILSAELDPNQIELRCAIKYFGNECHPMGPDRRDYLAENHPRLKAQMVDLSNEIQKALPPLAGSMKHSLETQEEAVIFVCGEMK